MINLRETKRIKQLLADSPGNYLSAIETTSLAICITNKDGNFVAVNDNYVQLYGYSREELIGKHFTVVLPEENKKALSDYHNRFFVDKYEIIRKWVVKNKSGQLMEIFADAGYNDQIENQPNKVTLVQFMKFLDSLPADKDIANNSAR